MSMSKAIAGPRRVKVWQADATWPDDTYVVPAEDLDLVTTDRDIKAANLQLLVEKVLAWEIADQAFFDVAGADYYPTSDDPDAVETAGNVVGDAQQEMVDLARSLKQ